MFTEIGNLTVDPNIRALRRISDNTFDNNNVLQNYDDTSQLVSSGDIYDIYLRNIGDETQEPEEEEEEEDEQEEDEEEPEFEVEIIPQVSTQGPSIVEKYNLKNINEEKDPEEIKSIKTTLIKLTPQELEDLPVQYIPGEGNDDKARELIRDLNQKLGPEFKASQLTMFLVNWKNAQSRKRRRLTESLEEQESTENKFGQECVNEIDYNTQQKWKQEPISIKFINPDKKEITQCYELDTFKKILLENSQTIFGRWLPNDISSGKDFEKLIDEQGYGGGSSFLQVYRKFYPNNYIVWNNSVKEWLAEGITKYVAYCIATYVRIGNLASLFGVSLTHGGDKVSIYYLCPDKEDRVEYLRDYLEYDLKKRIGEKYASDYDFTKMDATQLMSSSIQIQKDFPSIEGEYIGTRLSHSKIFKELKDIPTQVRKDYSIYQVNFIIDEIRTGFGRLIVSQSQLITRVMGKLSLKKVKKTGNPIRDILQNLTYLKRVLLEQFPQIDYSTDTKDKLADAGDLLDNFSEIANLFDNQHGDSWINIYHPEFKDNLVNMGISIRKAVSSVSLPYLQAKLPFLETNSQVKDEVDIDNDLYDTLVRLEERIPDMSTKLDLQGKVYTAKNKVESLKKDIETQLKKSPIVKERIIELVTEMLVNLNQYRILKENYTFLYFTVDFDYNTCPLAVNTEAFLNNIRVLEPELIKEIKRRVNVKKVVITINDVTEWYIDLPSEQLAVEYIIAVVPYLKKLQSKVDNEDPIVADDFISIISPVNNQWLVKNAFFELGNIPDKELAIEIADSIDYRPWSEIFTVNSGEIHAVIE